jgi:sporulation protein YlmC with PRC-barrel domain
MSHDLLLSHLVGRVVHDVDGRKVGRIEELIAQIELHEHGNDYVISEFHVGAYGFFEALTGSRFARKILQRVKPLAGYRKFQIPWEWMDLSDFDHPRVTRACKDLDVTVAQQ